MELPPGSKKKSFIVDRLGNYILIGISCIVAFCFFGADSGICIFGYGSKKERVRDMRFVTGRWNDQINVRDFI